MECQQGDGGSICSCWVHTVIYPLGSRSGFVADSFRHESERGNRFFESFQRRCGGGHSKPRSSSFENPDLFEMPEKKNDHKGNGGFSDFTGSWDVCE